MGYANNVITPEMYEHLADFFERDGWPVVESDDGQNYVALCGDPKCDLAYEHERFVCSGICNGFEGYVPEPYPEDEYR